MKKVMLILASLGLAGSLAVCAQEPDDTIVTESQRDTDRSMDERQQESMDERQQDSAVASDYDRGTTRSGPTDTQADQQAGTGERRAGMGKDLSEMTAEELKGKKVLTLAGEEVGEIDDVGISATQQARVVTVDVGGFLGISEKTIAIPLSELQLSVSDEDSVNTSMTRTSIESLPEFDESDFNSEDEETETL